MKLSDAIREGAALRPPTSHGALFEERDGVVCSCALGAAAEAAGFVDEAILDGLRHRFTPGYSPAWVYYQLDKAFGIRRKAPVELGDTLVEHGLASNSVTSIRYTVEAANDTGLRTDEDPRLAIADALEAVGL